MAISKLKAKGTVLQLLIFLSVAANVSGTKICSTSTDCDSNLGFTDCIDAVCKCHPGSNESSDETKPCTISVVFGEKCGWDSNTKNGHTYRVWKQCGENQICTSENICKCQKGFAEFRNVTRSEYSEEEDTKSIATCISALEKIFDTKCVNNTCLSCKVGEFLNATNQICQTKLGSPCKHSHMYAWNQWGSLRMPCPDEGKSMTCSINTCDCSYFFYPKDGVCLPYSVHGEACSAEVPCNNPLESGYGWNYQSNLLVCSADGVCACQDPINQAPNGNKLRKTCASILHGNCTDNSECNDGLECNLETKQCVCSSRLFGKDFLIVDRKCYPFRMRYPCKFDDYSTEPSDLKYLKIRCINGMYLCKNQTRQIYNAEIRRCVTKPGEICYPSDADRGTCPPGFTCKILSDQTVPKFTCQCDTGLSPTSEGKCNLGYGASCKKMQKGCNTHAGFVCSYGKCECLDESLKYDERAGECLGTQGSFCGKARVQGHAFDINCQLGFICVKNNLHGNKCQLINFNDWSKY